MKRDKLGKFIKGHSGNVTTQFKKGQPGAFKGRHHTKEAIEKFSSKKRGKPTWMKGKHHSEETKRKMRIVNKRIGSKNGMWKGEDVGYYALHQWIKRKLGSASFCSFDSNHKVKRYHWANISGSYLRDVSDYTSLCPACHKQYDMIRRGRVYLR